MEQKLALVIDSFTYYAQCQPLEILEKKNGTFIVRVKDSCNTSFRYQEEMPGCPNKLAGPLGNHRFIKQSVLRLNSA